MGGMMGGGMMGGGSKDSAPRVRRHKWAERREAE